MAAPLAGGRVGSAGEHTLHASGVRFESRGLIEGRWRGKPSAADEPAYVRPVPTQSASLESRTSEHFRWHSIRTANTDPTIDRLGQPKLRVISRSDIWRR